MVCRYFFFKIKLLVSLMMALRSFSRTYDLMASCDTVNKENVGGVNMIVCMSQVLACCGKGEMNKGQRYRKECHL
jgi:hypothetical protein